MTRARTESWTSLRRSALGVLAATALVVAACGGSETSQATNDPTATPAAAEPTATAPPAPTATSEAAPATATAVPDPTATVAPTPTVEPTPTTFDVRGPYAAGVLTERIDDRDVEIWYPVDADAVSGEPTEIFDALTAFPETLRAIVPPELSGEYDTLAVRDAPAASGSFPVAIYGHGFGGYRQIATHFTSHLASWGFVVASTDHLERGIGEQTLDLIDAGQFDETNSRADAAVADVANTIDLLAELNDSGPLAATMLLDQLVISGHSAGAGAAVQAAAAESDRIAGWISISGGTRDGISLTQPGMVIIGELDAVVPAERSYELFETAGVPQVLLNIEGGGHNSFTDPCRGITDLGGLAALTALLGDEQVARAEDGCTPDSLSPEVAQAMVNHAVVAWLNDLFALELDGAGIDEETLTSLGPLVELTITE